MAYKPLSSRQSINSAILQQLFPYVGSQTLDILLASLNSEVTPPFVVDATSSPSLVVNVGPSNVFNSESNRNHSASFIGSVLPSLTSGTVTFPSSSGGNITTSTGGSTPLVLLSGDYCAVLISIDQSNNLGTSVGTPAGSPSAVVVPPPSANTLSIAYVIVQNLAGVIQNITQNNIFQLAGGSGSGGSGGGAAQETPLLIGSTSVTVTFGSPRSDSTYGVVCQIANTVDASPAYIPLTITNKSTTGFMVSWNSPLETSNYALDWIVGPGVSEQVGEFPVSTGVTSATISFPIAFLSTDYVVVANMSDYVDASVAYQPLTVTNKTVSQFTVNWNAPTSTGNYRISWQVAAYQ
jgi:hypothetical protein